MNARVDPAALFKPEPGDEDVALTALCRVALREVEREDALNAKRFELEDRFDRLKPGYPQLPWMYGFDTRLAPKLSSVRLKELAEDPGHDAAWRRNMKTQITAVARWERECDGLRKSIGLAKVERQREAAAALAGQYVDQLAETPASTIEGAAWKAIVISKWIAAGYDIGADLGERLATSILEDVRRLGAVDPQAGARRRRRRAAA